MRCFGDQFDLLLGVKQAVPKPAELYRVSGLALKVFDVSLRFRRRDHRTDGAILAAVNVCSPFRGSAPAANFG